MKLFAAKSLSVMAHPVFVNLLCLFLLFLLFPQLNFGMSPRMKMFLIAYIFIATSIIPLLLVLVMKVTGIIESVLMTKKEDRKYPYLFTAAMYLITWYNFNYTSHAQPVILKYLLACASIVLLVLLINFYNKISVHLATLGGLCGLILSSGFWGFGEVRVILLAGILLSGLVGSARIATYSHTNQQVYSGFLLGFSVMILMFIY